MSNENNSNEELNDYLDLLSQYSEKETSSEAISLSQKIEIEKNKPDSNKKEALPDVVDENFFENFNLKTETQDGGDIEAFFEPKKVVKKVGPPPMVNDRAQAQKAFKEAKVRNNTANQSQNIPNTENIDVNQEEEQTVKKEKNVFKRLSNWFNNLPKKKKIIVSVLAIILVISIVLVTSVGIFIGRKFGLMNGNNGFVYDDTIYDDIDVGEIKIDIGSEGFKQSLIDWATTGNDRHMSSKNVINVLLIGADSRQGVNEGNTDVMMLVSVNKKAKTLKMVSFLRDSYLYIEGKKHSYCTKLNAAFSMGGPECLIQTIENNYKIKIDNYVMVNFESFKDIVDEMGGITVDVKDYEAREVESYFKFSMPSGEDVTLTGEQALAFCRIRKCDADGDVSRTRRQRQVIDRMVDRVMDSSVSEINRYIDVFLPYVATGYSESEILSLGFSAIAGGWAAYERKQLSIPSEDCRTSGDANMWIWVVDYEKAAYELQMELYGESNIKLDDTRVSIIDIYKGADYQGSSSGNSSSNETKAPDTTVPQSTQPLSTEAQPPTIPYSTEQDVPDTSTEETEPPTEETPTDSSGGDTPGTEPAGDDNSGDGSQTGGTVNE